MVPMLSEATSGLKVAAGRTRSSMVMVAAPPVVMLTTHPERCLITLRKGSKASGLWSERPSLRPPGRMHPARQSAMQPGDATGQGEVSMKIAITGGAGLLGNRLARHLAMSGKLGG